MHEQPALFDDFTEMATERPPMSELAERAAFFGPQTLTDTHALALLLEPLDPKASTGWAKALLARFGSLSAVFGAELEALALIVGRRAAVHLNACQNAFVRVSRAQIERRTLLTNWAVVTEYLKAAMAHETREQFRVLFLDKKNQLISDEIMSRGTVDHAPVYPREVVRRALLLDASAMVLAHNHPSGDPTPSGADIDMTRQIVDAAKALRIAVHDHLIIGRDGVASLKSLGMM